MNVLVTGGSGGLGTAVCKALSDRGDQVFVCVYRIKNSMKLKLLNMLPMVLQDRIYLSATK